MAGSCFLIFLKKNFNLYTEGKFISKSLKSIYYTFITPVLVK